MKWYPLTEMMIEYSDDSEDEGQSDIDMVKYHNVTLWDVYIKVLKKVMRMNKDSLGLSSKQGKQKVGNLYHDEQNLHL